MPRRSDLVYRVGARRIGIAYAQGHYIGIPRNRPYPPDEIAIFRAQPEIAAP